jgi:hypothetical protein
MGSNAGPKISAPENVEMLTDPINPKGYILYGNDYYFQDLTGIGLSGSGPSTGIGISSNPSSIRLFGGSNTQITYGGTRNFGPNFSFEAIAKFDTVATGYRVVVGHGTASYNNYITTNPSPTQLKMDVVATGTYYSPAYSTPSTNVWYHVVGITSQGGGSGTSFALIYVNGTLAQSTALTKAYLAPDGTLRIGATYDGQLFDNPSNILYLRIYDKALSASEVLTNYHSHRSRVNLT